MERNGDNLVNTLYDSGMLWLVLTSLISADNNMTNDERLANVEGLYNLINHTKDKTCKLPDGMADKVAEYCRDGIELLRTEIAKDKNFGTKDE